MHLAGIRVGVSFESVLPNRPAHKRRRYHSPCAKMPNVHSSCQAHNSRTSFGLIRQYLPKGQSMKHLTQHDCNAIARPPNQRPRKRLGYRTPEECYEP